MEAEKCRIDRRGLLNLEKMPTGAAGYGYSKADKASCQLRTSDNLARIALLQEKLYAEGKQGVIIVLQAMDAAGKDSTIKHVMSTVNPQGVDVVSFKQPTSIDLAHDFLWRAVQGLPVRGKMAIFNRSYYEDVLVVKVHQMQKGYNMADRCINDPDFFQKRYRHIRGFEQYLTDNSYRVVKIFLHVSKDTQRKRFLERLDDPSKNWKFSSSDLKERAFWDEYHKAYQTCIDATATEECPWYVVPADQKWFTRYLVSEIVLDALEQCAPEYPTLPAADCARIAECKALLGEMTADEKAAQKEKQARKQSKKDKKHEKKRLKAEEKRREGR